MSDIRAEFTFESKKFLQNLQDELEKAQSRIDIEVYIWQPDDVGNSFFQTLLRAARRGVKVRLLMDGVGSVDWLLKGFDTLTIHKNMEVRVYNKFPGVKDFASKVTTNFSKMNRRNHRKMYLIDHQIAYLGSFNITQDTLNWQEECFRIDSKNEVHTLCELFDYTWKGSKNLYTKIKEYNPIHLENEIFKCPTIFTTQTLRLRRQYKKAFLDRMDAAHERVWLITPYFNPPPSFLKVIRETARRGVDVRLILPALSDIVFLSWMARLHYRKLLDAGVKIFEYKPSFIHSKIAIIDNEAIVGSGNINYRSFFRDLEINLVLRDPENIATLDKHFRECTEKSTPVEKAFPFPFWQSSATNLLMVFKTWF